jgi:hypothetical protein
VRDLSCEDLVCGSCPVGFLSCETKLMMRSGEPKTRNPHNKTRQSPHTRQDKTITRQAATSVATSVATSGCLALFCLVSVLFVCGQCPFYCILLSSFLYLVLSLVLPCCSWVMALLICHLVLVHVILFFFVGFFSVSFHVTHSFLP